MQSIRLAPHEHGVEGGERWPGQHLPQRHPAHDRWPRTVQRNEEVPDYDEEHYLVDARTRNWPDGSYRAPHWQDGGIPYDPRRGGSWNTRVPMPRSNVPRPRYPSGRGHIVDHVYYDRDGYVIEHPVRRSMYVEGESHGYGRPPSQYADNEPIVGDGPPLLPPNASTLQTHTLPSTGPLQAPAHDADRPPACTSDVTEDVYNFEHFIPEPSATKNTPTLEDTAQPILSRTKGRHTMQLVCEKEESDRMARGLKPFWVECNSAGHAIETGRGGSRFMEVFRAFCVAILDVSTIRVRDQNIEDYAKLREKVEAEFEFIGHPMSDDGFFSAVSKCMKGERSRLHRLYIARPERGCPPKEQPDVWEKLKTHWSTMESGKVANVGSAPTQTATTPQDVSVSTELCYTPLHSSPYCT